MVFQKKKISFLLKMTWTMFYHVDKEEYSPLYYGTLSAEIENKSNARLLILRVVLNFDWMGDVYWYKDCNVELKPNERKKLPDVGFEIELDAEVGTHLFRPGIVSKNLSATGWSESELSYVGKGKHIIVKKAPKRDAVVFISHSNHADDEHIVELCKKSLQNCGFDPYLAEGDPKPGYPLWLKIYDMVRKANSILILWTNRGAESGDIREEIGIAIGAKKTKKMVPLVEKGVEPKGSLKGLEYVIFDPDEPIGGFSKAIKKIVILTKETRKGVPSAMAKP